MLVNMNEILLPAKKYRYGVGMFNAVNMEFARALISVAEKKRAPLIFGTAEIFLPITPLEELSYLLIPMAKKSKVPVALHLDHGLTEKSCKEALELGFTSIMYDCSTEPYETNVKKVKEMAKMAHFYNATIEGELGHVGNNEGSLEGDTHLDDPTKYYTDPDQAYDFVKRTGVDALAIAVGSAHGAYKMPPSLDFERIKTIASIVDVPLVLHGGSGLSNNDFKKSISSGISKINIFTDINCAGANAAKNQLQEDGTSLIHTIPRVIKAIEDEAEKKIQLFGSSERY